MLSDKCVKIAFRLTADERAAVIGTKNMLTELWTTCKKEQINEIEVESYGEIALDESFSNFINLLDYIQGGANIIAESSVG